MAAIGLYVNRVDVAIADFPSDREDVSRHALSGNRTSDHYNYIVQWPSVIGGSCLLLAIF